MFQDVGQHFQPFSPTHLITVGLLTVFWGVVIWIGLKWRGTRKLLRWERGFAGLTLLSWLVIHGWGLHPANFAPARSLPIHICDVVGLLMPLALMWRKRPFVALLYFWGIGFSLQGVLTPDLQLGPATLAFWIFWLHHGAIIGTAIYMVIVHRFRPTWKDYRLAIRAGFLYLAVVLPINIIFGFNYGYLGNMRPSQPSLIDLLGPWPWRVVLMVVLAWIGMTLLQVPWEFFRCRRHSNRHSIGV
ncbi:MAG: TIGR02206 family membrane protein [Leptolyngbyaceae cyanobacterium MO_188.B28]|nr:TIGR02206 family membrane protein [Leptolyngbyaceae cyanobacterium MO_188.B28]